MVDKVLIAFVQRLKSKYTKCYCLYFYGFRKRKSTHSLRYLQDLQLAKYSTYEYVDCIFALTPP